MFSTAAAYHFYFEKKRKEKMLSLACDIKKLFFSPLYSPNTHLQLLAVHSIRFSSSSSFQPREVFGVFLLVRELYFGNLGIWSVCVCVALFCPLVYKHVPSISSFHRQGLCGRRISSLPLCLPKLSSSLSNLPPQRPRREHIPCIRGTVRLAPYFHRLAFPPLEYTLPHLPSTSPL